MANERIEIEIVLDDGSVQKGFAKIEKQGTKAAKKIEKSFDRVGDAIRASAPAIAAFTAVVFTLVKSIKAFSEFERQLVAVGKTTNITGDALQGLGARIQEIGKDVPISTANLLKLAETAGQFGVVGTDNIVAFTETLAKLELATDIVGDEGAKSLARILSVTKESTASVGKLGAVIVELGNNFAASESEIVKVATEVAKITSVFGATSSEIAGISAALKQSGVEAAAGGTAVGKAFIAINDAISKGGSTLERFAKISGKTSKQLKEDFAENATKSFQDLIKGLGGIKEGGGDVIKTLGQLGLADVRVTKSLLPLINNYKVLERSLFLANDQAIKQTALNQEAATASDTLSGDIIKLTTSFDNLFIAVGALFGPGSRQVVQLFTDFSESITNLATVLRADISGDIAKLRFELGGIAEEIEAQDRIIKQNVDDGGLFGLRKAARNLFGDPTVYRAELQKQSENIVAEIQLLQDRLNGTVEEGTAKRKEILTVAAAEAAPIIFNTLSNTFFGFSRLIGSAFSEFSSKLNDVILFTETQSVQIAKNFGSTFGKGITKTIQGVVKAVQDGNNSFEALGAGLLNLVADLAISIGQFVVALGVAKLAAESLPGGATIAAGLGLIAIGTILKAVSGSGLSTEGGTAGGAPGTFAGTEAPEVPDSEDFQQQTAVTINVDGTVIDPKTTGENIATALQEYFDASGGQLVVT